MKAICMVAHPDDCVIFGYHFMKHTSADWHICYLTYDKKSERAREISEFWHKRGITTEFLACPDQWADTVEQYLHFDTEYFNAQIQHTVNKYHMVLTHNVDGDYGHIHHKFVHNAVSKTTVPQVYFASDFNCNLQLALDLTIYDLSELPLHADVISQIHDRSIGRYFVTSQAKGILNYNV